MAWHRVRGIVTDRPFETTANDDPKILCTEIYAFVPIIMCIESLLSTLTVRPVADMFEAKWDQSKTDREILRVSALRWMTITVLACKLLLVMRFAYAITPHSNLSARCERRYTSEGQYENLVSEKRYPHDGTP